jgi:hypothetical protein
MAAAVAYVGVIARKMVAAAIVDARAVEPLHCDLSDLAANGFQSLAM